MRPFVKLRAPDGTVHELGHGDLIGRVPTAALVLDDPRVSEAHAMVSLRGESLRLLSLRRVIVVDGEPQAEVELEEGQVLTLTDGLTLEVLDVALPDTVAALEGEGLPRQVLPPVASLTVRPRARLVPRYEPAADAWLWSTGEQWHLRVGEAAPQPVAVGHAFALAGRRFALVAVPLAEIAAAATEVDLAFHGPLRIVARYDTVHIHREGHPITQLNGVPARIVSELVAVGQPLAWEALTRQLWPREDDRQQLRRRLDMGLLRLRRRLRGASVRTDLVRASGNGLMELVLGESDVVVNET